MKFIRILTLVLFIGTLGSVGATFAQSGGEDGPAADQPQGHGEMARPGAMGRGHDVMRNRLGLTEDQAQKLHSLWFDFKKGAIRRRADLRIARLELHQVLEQKTVDLGQTEKKVREIERLRGDLQLFRIQSMMKAKDFLTEEQFAKFKHHVLAHRSHRWRGTARMHGMAAMHHGRGYEAGRSEKGGEEYGTP